MAVQMACKKWKVSQDAVSKSLTTLVMEHATLGSLTTPKPVALTWAIAAMIHATKIRLMDAIRRRVQIMAHLDSFAWIPEVVPSLWMQMRVKLKTENGLEMEGVTGIVNIIPRSVDTMEVIVARIHVIKIMLSTHVVRINRMSAFQKKIDNMKGKTAL